MSQQETYLKEIADAIREKKGTTEKIVAKQFATEILNLTGGLSGDEVEQFATENARYATLLGVQIQDITQEGNVLYVKNTGGNIETDTNKVII